VPKKLELVVDHAICSRKGFLHFSYVW
jgi:hypothetical protein